MRRKPRPRLAVCFANAVSISVAKWGLEIHTVEVCLAVRMVEVVKPRASLEDIGMSTRFDLWFRPA